MVRYVCTVVNRGDSNSLNGGSSAGQEDRVQLLQQWQSGGEGEVVIVQGVVMGHQAMLQVVHWESWYMTPANGGGRLMFTILFEPTTSIL